MKIKFRQTGGFAGLVKSGSFDLESMDEDESKELKSLVDQMDLSSPSSEGKSESRGADLEQYSIEIEEGGKSRTLYLTQGSLPDRIRPLIRFLRKRSRYEKR